MLVVFKQQYKKLIFKPSTFLFTLVYIFLSYASFKLVNAFSSDVWVGEAIDIIYIFVFQTYNKLLIWFILPGFVAAKSAGFIADELEDGTFLTILSKPISRSRIIIEKFAALIFVNASWIFAMQCITWWVAIKSMPYKFVSDLFLQTLLTLFIAPLVVSVILSILLTVLSLKVRSSLVIGLGASLGIISYVAPYIVNISIIKNAYYQNSVGRVVSVAEYKKINTGQTKYKPFRFINYPQHSNQIYYKELGKTLKQYNIQRQINSSYNKEIIFEKYMKNESNKLGKKTKKLVYKVTKAKDWISSTTLYIAYTLLTLLCLIYGYLYFRKKDII